MILSRKRILNSCIFLVAMVCIFLYPKFFDYARSDVYASIRLIFRYLPYTLFPAIIILCWNGNKEAHKLYYLVIAFRASFLFSDMINGIDQVTFSLWIRCTMWILVAVVLFCTAIHYNPLRTLKLTRAICNIMLVVNIICEFLFPRGLARIEMLNYEYNVISWSDNVGFIDVGNRLSLFIILTFFVNMLYQYKVRGKIENYFFVVLIGVNTLLAQSASGFCALIVLLLYLFFAQVKSFNKLINGYWIFGVYALVSSIFVVFQRFGIMQFFITNILGRSMNLSNRTTIWAYYISEIIRRPIVGYGTMESGGLFRWNGQTWYAHNQILDILIQGGIVALIVVIVLIVLVKRHNRKNEVIVSGLFSICLLAYLVVGMAEHFLVNLNVCFYIFLAIAYSSNKIFEKTSISENGGNEKCL